MNHDALKALLYQKLDPANEEHWTGQGLPRIDTVNELLGIEATRQTLTEAAPELTRESLLLEIAASERSGVDQIPGAAAAAAPMGAAGGELAGDQGDEDREPDDEELMAMPTRLVLSNRTYVERVIRILSQRSTALIRKRSLLNDELDQLHRKSQIATRALERMPRMSNSDQNQAAIRNYLRQSGKHREQRAQRAQTFISAGTTAADVAEQLRSKSKLDTAMEGRKPAPGSVRPPPRRVPTV